MFRVRLYGLLLICAVLASCAGVPPRGLPGAPFIASPSFDERRPNLVVIHHTSNQDLRDSLRTLTSTARQVSAHYLISRDGRILQLVDERNRAWHAGVSWWNGQTDVNSASIGIELDNDGNEPFAAAQIQALLVLLADLKERYRIPTANFVGHADVAPGRKVDPSAWFPWDQLARKGFGLWCNGPLQDAPAGFDLDLALAALGYDPTRPQAARHAFLLHFWRGPEPGLREQNALAYCLLQQRAAAR
ncbi:N-acetylmuramoyl-L-alanine amidase [Castellaniella sp.]|uniref:N-acetylmuramoyl-L-alanine amidase n=1 Tax=Castellaniella sp. TaxID=1955812 RepID=UPI0035669A8F